MLSAPQLFTTKSRLLTTLTKKPFETIEGKGENAGNQYFLLFPQCFFFFQPYQGQESSFMFSSANALNLDQSKILSFGNDLNLWPTKKNIDFLKMTAFEDNKFNATKIARFIV